MKTVHRRRARWLPLAAALLWLPQAAGASVPATLGFEGRLETLAGGPVADGDYTLSFALYGDDKTATASWTETATVKVAAGRFSHALGSVQALAPATLDATGAGWVGVRVGQDPELPRSPLRAVGFAARAALAEGLACSGCVGVGALKFNGDIDLGGNSLKAKNASFSGDVVAKTVTATSLVGDGSKLTGVQIAGGSCKSGEVVTGVKADGSVICGAAPATTIAGGKCQAGQVVTEVKADGSVVCGAVQAALPPDGLSAISNGLLTNVFDETFAGPELPKAIPDNNPSGVLSEIVIGDIGTLQGITVSVDIETSDLSGLAVTLFDPDNNVYKLHDKSGTGTALKATFPTPTKTVSGDLTQWVGKNPKGTWRLIVADWKPTAGGNDGQLKGWSLGLKVLSSKKIKASGSVDVEGGLAVNGDASVQTLQAESQFLEPGKSVVLDAGMGLVNAVATAWIKIGDEWLSVADSFRGGGCIGCGSGKDGMFAPTTNITLTSDAEYSSFLVPTGVTVTIEGTVVIKVQGSVLINGKVVVVQSASASKGLGAGQNGSAGSVSTCYDNVTPGSGAGGGYGTTGQAGSLGAKGGVEYGATETSELLQGSAGGSSGAFKVTSYGSTTTYPGAPGGAGGGGLHLVASSIVVSGSLDASGKDGGISTAVGMSCKDGFQHFPIVGGGGGSGGTIWMQAAHVSLTGTVTAIGGKGGTTLEWESAPKIPGGDGAVGRILVTSLTPIIGTTSPPFVEQKLPKLAVGPQVRVRQMKTGQWMLTNDSSWPVAARLVVVYLPGTSN